MTAMEIAHITVNGIEITQAQIDEECSNHSAEKSRAARRSAIRSLVVRELLLQEAVKRGLCDRDGAINQPDETVERLLASEIEVSAPDESDCKSYFKNNRESFSTAPLYEASHIFFPAPPGEHAEREDIRAKAVGALGRIKENSDCFDDIARSESACSSAIKGGYLGQLTKGQTVPAFEAALMTMNEGDISTQPVETEVGFHIIRVDERIDGEDLPFDMVKSWISQTLTEQRWKEAVGRYVSGLAGQARVEGFDVNILQS